MGRAPAKKALWLFHNQPDGFPIEPWPCSNISLKFVHILGQHLGISSLGADGISPVVLHPGGSDWTILKLGGAQDGAPGVVKVMIRQWSVHG